MSSQLAVIAPLAVFYRRCGVNERWSGGSSGGSVCSSQSTATQSSRHAATTEFYLPLTSESPTAICQSEFLLVNLSIVDKMIPMCA